MFIGSVNFDPRSEGLNTEFGLLVRSPQLAAEAIGLMELLKQKASYRVRLKEDSSRDLEWVWIDACEREKVIDTEPSADFYTRLKLYIQSFLIPEFML
jgi:putative cardiolipin synthase